MFHSLHTWVVGAGVEPLWVWVFPVGGVLTSITWISVSSLEEYRSLNKGILPGGIFSYFHSALEPRMRQAAVPAVSIHHMLFPYTSTLISTLFTSTVFSSSLPVEMPGAVLRYLCFKLSWHFLTLRISLKASMHLIDYYDRNDIHCFQVCLEYCQKLIHQVCLCWHYHLLHP